MSLTRISLTAVEDFGFTHATYTIPNDMLHKIKQTEYSRKTLHFFFYEQSSQRIVHTWDTQDPTRS